MQDASLKVEVMAEIDARWIFGLVALCLVVLGWFWQKIMSVHWLRSQSNQF